MKGIRVIPAGLVMLLVAGPAQPLPLDRSSLFNRLLPCTRCTVPSFLQCTVRDLVAPPYSPWPSLLLRRSVLVQAVTFLGMVRGHRFDGGQRFAAARGGAGAVARPPLTDGATRA